MKIKVGLDDCKQIILEINPDLSILEILNETDEIVGYTDTKVEPFRAIDGKLTKTDIWKTPNELGLTQDDELILNRYLYGGAAGILPLNALYNNYLDLYRLFRNQHKGIQAIFLYTEADTEINEFMNKYKYSDLIEMSSNCVIYTPINDIYKENHAEFKDWWNKEYKDFKSAYKKIEHEFWCMGEISSYKMARKLNISLDKLPCIAFFQNHPATQITIVEISYENEDRILLETLRKIFVIVDKVNSFPNEKKIGMLCNELKQFKGNNYSRFHKFPLINIDTINISPLQISDLLKLIFNL